MRGTIFMESATHSSTNEKSNYANLCRFLVEVGPLVLCEIFNKVCPPGNLYTVLVDTKNYEKLRTLRKKRVLSYSQWRKLYPVVRLTVSSKDFDSSLVLLLLSNIFGVTLPTSGWNSIPLINDKSPRADITRVKILRDKVYSHAADDSIEGELFNSYWCDIKDTFLRIRGAWSEDAINDFKPVCMDADQEKLYRECLKEWLKDDDFITDESHEQGTIKKARKKEDMDGSMEISGEKLGMEGMPSAGILFHNMTPYLCYNKVSFLVFASYVNLFKQLSATHKNELVFDNALEKV
ncbi:E3 ubiquitin-protein ligase DZIP3 [Stylophora pistillata]|uniref:E3 ubiquitin-protein ligase DZIP3 n=1 Tax=Stylophora pistillata TaxID=50429 RepID=A0A2B4SV96_STYPI|nr:E3 ubiquitin-protein ligase DZIP3 [Stylophora pistillata]